MTQEIKNIIDLINLAEINLKVCEHIQDTLQAKKNSFDKKEKFLILVSNNAFHQSVGIVHGILCSTKKEDIKIKPILENILKHGAPLDFSAEDQDEATKLFEQLLQDYPAVDYFSYSFIHIPEGELIGDRLAFLRKLKRQDKLLLKKLEEFKKEFEAENFHKIRHQTVAHKNKKLTEPAGAIRLLLKPDYLPKLGKIIIGLKIVVSYFGFDYALENNDMEVLAFLKDLLDT